jgi:HEAT repeat protein
MPVNTRWGTTPRLSIESECARRGVPAVVAGCVLLVEGSAGDPTLIMALGGPASARFLGESSRADRYWLRVWGMRGLLWAWEDGNEAAADVVRAALTDESWRVREMAAKVVAKRSIGEALPAVVSG